MINTVRSVTTSRCRLVVRAVLASLGGGHAAGCATPVLEIDPPLTEGEAILAALEHVAESNRRKNLNRFPRDFAWNPSREKKATKSASSG